MKINIELNIPDGPVSECLAGELNSLDRLDMGWQQRAPFHLRLLLLDALHEFDAHRLPAEKYVKKRYPNTGSDWREHKIEQVKTRRGIARTLHTSLTIEGITITELPES